MKISTVVLNYNGLSETLDCLNSLRKIQKKNFTVETIVVDNNSSNGSFEVLSKLKGIEFISNSQNLGFSGGNNMGIKKAILKNTDAVLILKNDSKITIFFQTR